jgi:hypothetical protein
MASARLQACALLAVVVGAGITAASIGSGATLRTGIYCGADASTPRSAVKTLTDRAARRIDWTPPNTTIRKLRSLERPPRITKRTPRQRAELQVFRLHARLLRFQLRTSNDYELVIADPRNARQTMLAVIPSPDCTTGAQHRVAMTRARSTFNRQCLNLRRPAFVTVTGVLFFAPRPLPARSAPNGAELAPLLGFSSSC